MLGSTAFPFFIFAKISRGKAAGSLPRIRSLRNTVIGNDVRIGRDAVVMPGVCRDYPPWRMRSRARQT